MQELAWEPETIEKVPKRGRPILKRLPAGRPVMVEVGVSGARLSSWLLSQRLDLHLFAIDNWAPNEEQPAEYVATGDVHALLSRRKVMLLEQLARERLAGFEDRCVVLKRDSVSVAPEVGQVDLVFIDARHDYEGVRGDIEAWWPMVKSGGWLGGHDLSAKDPLIGVKRAVTEFTQANDLTFDSDEGNTWWVRKPCL